MLTHGSEQDLSANLGMKVVIDHKGHDGVADLTISHKSPDQFDELASFWVASADQSSPVGSR
ncbi:MAG: hypothetical protein R3D56_15085 [Paracoccaceae bacterium]